MTAEASTDGGSAEIGRLLRELAPQVLGAVARRYGDFAAAEDAVQEALIAAATSWPEKGVPANPRGWLFHVAGRRLTDHVRSEISRRQREDAVRGDAPIAVLPPEPGEEIEREADDSLSLLFMCCHPSLTPASAIALTLRAVGGLTTAEIARAFFVPEATMAQRISRAKQSIKDAGATFAMPAGPERDQRLGSVLHILYLMFNEGYASSSGESVHRVDLSSEAIRITRMLAAELGGTDRLQAAEPRRGEPGAAAPSAGEAAGLLALMLLTDARRDARTGPSGELIPLDEQDRSLWNREQIADGVALVESAISGGAVGPYQLQAAIAALHDEAETADSTDWRQILALYDVLQRIQDNPMVGLSRAIATAMVEGPHAGLAMVEAVAKDARLAGSHRVDAVRAHLLEQAGRRENAREAYLAAAERTASSPERNYLLMKAARLV